MSCFPVTADAGPPASGEPARRRRRRAGVAWVLGTAPAAAVLFDCYPHQSRTVTVGSDGAPRALKARDLPHGNPLLHGWRVTGASFCTTLAGLRPVPGDCGILAATGRCTCRFPTGP